MKPADDIEQAIKDLRFTTRAATDERILADGEDALEQSAIKNAVCVGVSIGAAIFCMIADLPFWITSLNIGAAAFNAWIVAKSLKRDKEVQST